MTGLPLFDICEKRHGGNAESQAANARIATRKPRQREAVLDAVQTAGLLGITCRELCEHWGCGMNDISGRFSELKRDERIMKIGTREGCAVYVVNDQVDRARSDTAERLIGDSE